ncbi:MAG: DUF2752 domain-containing protein [Lachnospiraceae bacterium]|nr:DUF2752 domain-containing protein [Lachnospiraceae bacterium]
MKNRNRFTGILILLGTGFAYFVWLKVTGLAIPCMFRIVTGWLCPGCGITTLIMNLTECNFAAAYQANPFLFVTGPLLAAELLYYAWLRYKGRKLPSWNNGLIIVYAIALCLFGAVRNLQ